MTGSRSQVEQLEIDARTRVRPHRDIRPTLRLRLSLSHPNGLTDSAVRERSQRGSEG